MPISFTSKIKGIQACSESPLFCRQWRKSLVDTDWIAHQYSQPSRPAQVHQVEYVATRTSLTQVHVPHNVGWLRRRTFQSSRVLFEASPPRWAVRLHSPMESPQALPHLEQHLLSSSSSRCINSRDSDKVLSYWSIIAISRSEFSLIFLSFSILSAFRYIRIFRSSTKLSSIFNDFEQAVYSIKRKAYKHQAEQ